MRRILDRPDRWAVAIVFLASVCTSVDQLDARHLAEVVPNLKILPTMAIIALVIIVIGMSWVLVLYLLSWIATPIGRMMGGTGTVDDVLFELWCIVLGSFTVAEAQRFSTQKGFVNVVITIALPLMVIFAAVFTLRTR